MAPPRKRSDAEVFATTRELVRAGGSALTMRAVSEATGLSLPTLFKRFGSRDALVRAALGVAGEPGLAPVTWLSRTSCGSRAGEQAEQAACRRGEYYWA